MTLRRRLTLVLALAVGLSGIALAAGSYFLVRHNLLSDSVDSSIVQTRRNLDVAPAYRDTGTLVDAYKSRGDFLTVATRGGHTFLSSTSVSLRSVPAGLRAIVDRGELGYERTTVAGDHFLVTGAPAGNGTKLYFFFPENGVRHELSVLRNVCSAASGSWCCSPRSPGPCWRAARCGRSRGRALPLTRWPKACSRRGCRSKGRDEFGAWAQSFNEMAAALEAKIGELAGCPGARAPLHRRRCARAANAADRAHGRGLAARRPARPHAAGVAPARRAADRGRRAPAPARSRI